MNVALVAGATRGAGRTLAVELSRAGAFVYTTGRSSRVTGPSDMDRPETIEETGDLMAAAGGDGVALRVDRLDVEAVRSLLDRVRSDHGRLDVAGQRHLRWRPLRAVGQAAVAARPDRRTADAADGIETHAITNAVALPLVLESGARDCSWR